MGTGGGSGGGTGGGTGAGTGGSGGGTTTGSTTVSGRVTYDFVPAVYSPATRSGTLAFAQTVVKPVRNAEVRVQAGMTVVAKVYTDESGNYSVSFNPPGGALTLLVLTRSQNPTIQVEDNTDSDLLWGMGGNLSGQTQTVNLHATHGWTGNAYDPNTRVAAAFAVLDSMYTASRAFMAVRNVQFPLLKVNWSPNNVPQAGDKTQGRIGTSHFSPAENEIYVLGAAGADTDEFDSHVIVHEWGHYFEANLSRSDSPGGRHGPGDVLDPRIAFGEAWGNALASMVLPETIYTDTNWGMSGLTAFGFDAENEPTPTDDPTPSAFSESSVLRALFDLYDTPSDGAFDQVAAGLGPVYDVMIGPEKTTDAMTTLGSFVTGLKAQQGINAAAVDTLLARYNIGPITSAFGDGDMELRGMYTDAAPLPFTGNIGLGGGNPPNSWQQNQYYVFTGTGGTVTVSATSTEDVAIAAYRLGMRVGEADRTTTGTESFTVQTQAGVKYVVVLTGFGQNPGDYNVSVSVQ